MLIFDLLLGIATLFVPLALYHAFLVFFYPQGNNSLVAPEVQVEETEDADTELTLAQA